jgi:catalase
MTVSEKKRTQHLTHATGTPVTDNLNILTAGKRGPALLQARLFSYGDTQRYRRQLQLHPGQRAKMPCPQLS